MHASQQPGSGPLVLVIDPDPDGRGSFLIRLPRTPDMLIRACQSAVGGYVEAIGPHGRDWACYACEDGKRLEMPVNETATALYHRMGSALREGDQLRGTVIFLGSNGTRETDVPEELLRAARSLIGGIALDLAGETS
jgi:hypothetical protein